MLFARGFLMCWQLLVRINMKPLYLQSMKQRRRRAVRLSIWSQKAD